MRSGSDGSLKEKTTTYRSLTPRTRDEISVNGDQESEKDGIKYRTLPPKRR